MRRGARRAAGNSSYRLISALVLACLLGAVTAAARQDAPPVKLGADDRLVYDTHATGQRILDFSRAGFGGGGVPLPVAPTRVLVVPAAGDAGARIQAALDQVGALPRDATTGLRGAVVLAPGRYEIAGQLRLRASGVVLRGVGAQEDGGTVLVATGTDRRALLLVGVPSAAPLATTDDVRVLGDVPAGAVRLRVARAAGLAVGARVVITRPSPAEWIKHLGMDEAPARQPYAWRPGAFNVRWDRVVTAIAGDTLTLDAPLTAALEQRFGGATLARVASDALAREVTHVGVENLCCVSAFDAAHPADEQHAWDAIRLDGVRDAWVSDVTGASFAGSLVRVGEGSARVTVQDCVSLAPVSEDAGYRRVTFHTAGQQTLFLRCRSEHGRHDFTAGYLAAGPNVFLDSTTRESTSFSGALGSWATGLLFDGVTIDGAALRLENLETWNQGVGWNAAHSVIWGSSAATLIVRSPPGAPNWAVGVWGQFVGDGRWAATSEFPTPRSLYRAQLGERLNAAALAALAPRTYPAVPTDLPVAAPPPLPATVGVAASAPGLALTGGWLTAGDRLFVGAQTGTEWWLGRLEPARASTFKLALTRFVPGRDGPGTTDDLSDVVTQLVASGQVALRHHWGLWYDRRRIDHQMIRRPDADVWPPFYELPWARSGEGRAWDGLSRYDLTRFNPWYFDRLRSFAAVARARGRVLIHEMYFQHNILESGAHWVDFPWRPVNALQPTGFTEPPPFTGDTIRMAAEFYDVSHPLRRDLHRRYIRECLARLAGEPNVLHTLTAENSGPLPFAQFWLDVIAEWQRETGRDVLIALSAPKDVQDAILADPARAALIDVIDLTYWWRDDAGREFAPPGGTDLAPRQHQRLNKNIRTTGTSLAGMVRDYRERFPAKAVISGLAQSDAWAFAAAGGSFPELPATTASELLAAFPRLRPVSTAALPATRSPIFQLTSADGSERFLYAPRGQPLTVDLTGVTGALRVRPIDLATGRLLADAAPVTAGGVVTLPRAGDANGPVACWLTR